MTEIGRPELSLTCPECGEYLKAAVYRGYVTCPKGHGKLIPAGDHKQAWLLSLPIAHGWYGRLWLIEGVVGIFYNEGSANEQTTVTEIGVIARSGRGGAARVFVHCEGAENEASKALGIETTGG